MQPPDKENGRAPRLNSRSTGQASSKGNQQSSGHHSTATDSLDMNCAACQDEWATSAAVLAHELTRLAVHLDSGAWAAAALHVYDAAILIHQAIEEAAS